MKRHRRHFRYRVVPVSGAGRERGRLLWCLSCSLASEACQVVPTHAEACVGSSGQRAGCGLASPKWTAAPLLGWGYPSSEVQSALSAPVVHLPHRQDAPEKAANLTLF